MGKRQTGPIRKTSLITHASRGMRVFFLKKNLEKHVFLFFIYNLEKWNMCFLYLLHITNEAFFFLNLKTCAYKFYFENLFYK